MQQNGRENNERKCTPHTYILLDRIESNIRILCSPSSVIVRIHLHIARFGGIFFLVFVFIARLARTAIRYALFDFCVIDRTQFSPNLCNSVLCAYKIEKYISKSLGPTEMHSPFDCDDDGREMRAHQRRNQCRGRKLIARCFLTAHNFIVHK